MPKPDRRQDLLLLLAVLLLTLGVIASLLLGAQGG